MNLPVHRGSGSVLRSRRGVRGVRLTLAAIAASVAAFAALPVPAADAAPKRFFGVVNQASIWDADFQKMRKAGVGTLRLQLGWPLVQQNEGRCQAGAAVGTCDWRGYDRVIGEAAARGVEVFPYLLNTAPFISDDQNNPPIRSKRARKAWRGFVEAAVKRYGRNGTYWWAFYPTQHPNGKPRPIRSWQVWNEPSAGPFWKPRPNAREYGKLVKLTSNAIAKSDPKGYVVLGGLFGTPTASDGGIRQDRFLRKLYRVKKIKRFFDAAAVHPYGPDLKRVRFQIRWARSEMRKARDRKAGLWISEIGWASDRSHNQLGVGKKGQAKMLRKSFKMFAKKRRAWKIKAVNWYAWQDSDFSGLCDFCRRSGLVNLDRDPKPSYRAFKRQAR